MGIQSLVAGTNAVELCDPASLTSSGDTPGYPVQNLQAWRSYLRWIGTGSGDEWIEVDAGAGKTFTVTALAIRGHNLHTIGAANLLLQWSADGSTGWTDCLAAFTPASDAALLVLCSATYTKQAFRLFIPSGSSAPPQIGMLLIGQYVRFPSGPQGPFDPDGQEVDTESQESYNGELLGQVELHGRRNIMAEFPYLSAAWVSAYYKPWWDANKTRPFFWAWDLEGHPTEVYVCWFREPVFDAPYKDGVFRPLTLDMIGVVE